MQMMAIRLDRLDGGRVDGLTGSRAFGAVLGRQRDPFAADPAGDAVLDRKRTVHDLLLGTVVVRSDR